MITNEEIIYQCTDCKNCKHLHKNDYNLHKQNCINCDKFIEKALELKDKQIKETIDNVLNYYQCEANQDLPTSTKAFYLNNFAVVRGAMNLLKQKLGIND